MSIFRSTKFETLEFFDDSKRRTLVCELRKSLRSRRINLRLKSPSSALLTFPQRMAWKEAEKFLQQQTDWLRRKSLEFPARIFMSDHFSGGGCICLDSIGSGKPVNVQIDPQANRTRTSLENQQVSIFVSSEENREYLIKEACRKLACQFLPSRLQWAEERTGLQSKRIRVGDQSTRWGSCSPRGTISLNWRIILLPEELGNYVIFHELTHLVEMNHSSRFWTKLEEFVPGAKEMDRKLSRAGKPVFALGRIK
ncbi:M48 family metallopeptidase [Opitutales bacterium]|nr:M48 family metallopeptidase [Opitutales bacterium]MDB3958418.1 M48 family metallopeptidase [Opitutales bacterium]